MIGRKEADVIGAQDQQRGERRKTGQLYRQRQSAGGRRTQVTHQKAGKNQQSDQFCGGIYRRHHLLVVFQERQHQRDKDQQPHRQRGRSVGRQKGFADRSEQYAANQDAKEGKQDLSPEAVLRRKGNERAHRDTSLCKVISRTDER